MSIVEYAKGMLQQLETMGIPCDVFAGLHRQSIK